MLQLSTSKTTLQSPDRILPPPPYQCRRACSCQFPPLLTSPPMSPHLSLLSCHHLPKISMPFLRVDHHTPLLFHPYLPLPFLSPPNPFPYVLHALRLPQHLPKFPSDLRALQRNLLQTHPNKSEHMPIQNLNQCSAMVCQYLRQNEALQMVYK